MKPLKRPMFRNGGPIKEGIMQGMKEPQAINTVGSPLAPKDSSGRQGYAIPIIGAGLMVRLEHFYLQLLEDLEQLELTDLCQKI